MSAQTTSEEDDVVYSNETDSTTMQDCVDTLPVHVAVLSVQCDTDQMFDDGETYDMGVDTAFGPVGYMAMFPDLEYALSSSVMVSTSWVNTLLDSECSHHPIKDRSLFSTYNVSGATSVMTANCGSLNTLASGDVMLHIPFEDRFVNLLLQNCLHAQDVPLHLLSVEVLQHSQIVICFKPASGHESPYTELVFPGNHPILPSFALHATLIRCLSFLACDFVPVIPLVSTLSPVLACPWLDLQVESTFCCVEHTPGLWHRCLSHLGMDAV